MQIKNLAARRERHDHDRAGRGRAARAGRQRHAGASALAPARDQPGAPRNRHGVQMGHVTGTVIDQRTGIPTAGVSVSVGG